MERVTFLVEETNERLSCMLNPETVVMKRSTGVKTRESLSGMISSSDKGDNPLLFTGAGQTTIELDLVFDISIAGSSIISQNVQDLTRPIWNLSENHQRQDGLYHPAVCRFIWGKSWNIPGVISAVAEKLESFSPEGVPRRSWIRLELIRTLEQPHSALNENDLWSGMENQQSHSFLDNINSRDIDFPTITPQTDSLNTTPESLENSFERIDLTADRLKGDPKFWRELSIEFQLEDPLQWVKNHIQQQNSNSEDQAPT